MSGNSSPTRREFLLSAGLGASGMLFDRKHQQYINSFNPGLRLWYPNPAPDWNEALPLGNGRIGAMVYGGVDTEHLQLNENTLYSEEPGRRDLKLDITEDYDKVKAMLRNRQYAEATDFITRNWLGRGQPCYQPLGDLHLNFDKGGGISNYTRDLDLARSIATVRYTQNGVNFTREYFISNPDEVMVMRLTADRPGSLNFRAALSSVHPTSISKAEGFDLTVMTGQLPGFIQRRELKVLEQRGEQWKYPELFDANGQRRPGAKQVLYGKEIDGLGMRFEARLKASIKGGAVKATSDGLHISRATEAILLFSAGTSFNGFDKSPSREGADPSARATKDLIRAMKKSFIELRKAHVQDYQKLFNRVSLDLGKISEQSYLPTDERITKFSNDLDPALATLYFQYGRYLMIAGSREGGQPLNLQGIWNPHVIPPWASAYTTNINAEMNYWPAEVTNLSECHQPFFRMIRELSVTGAEVSKQLYHRRGWVVHHNTSIWRDAQPVDNVARTSFWPMCGGWMCRHLWDHYLFTGDRQFLVDAYPLMKGAVEFYIDWLTDDGHGHLVTAVGSSPEINFNYLDEKGVKKTGDVTQGPTMDMAIVRELFANCIRASEMLDRDPDLRRELKDKLSQLLPYQIGKRGQLQEWPEDMMETDEKHRHISHLYSLYPSDQITRRHAPELFKAARRTLELRGDGGTGWSMAWKINFWARMEDGDHAYTLVRKLLSPAKTGEVQYNKGGVMPNLLCSHPPFQIDGNFGGTAGIAEMLLQSHKDEIHLLPALPEAWASGNVKGLCARGGYTINIKWQNRSLIEAVIKSKLGGECIVRLEDKTIRLKTQKGGTYRITSSMFSSLELNK